MGLLDVVFKEDQSRKGHGAGSLAVGLRLARQSPRCALCDLRFAAPVGPLMIDGRGAPPYRQRLFSAERGFVVHFHSTC